MCSSDNFTCCHTEREVADQTFHLTQSQHTDTKPTSPSAGPITPGAWQGSHWSANFEVTGVTRPRKTSRRKRDSDPGSSAVEVNSLTTRPARRGVKQASKQATTALAPGKVVTSSCLPVTVLYHTEPHIPCCPELHNEQCLKCFAEMCSKGSENLFLVVCSR